MENIYKGETSQNRPDNQNEQEDNNGKEPLFNHEGTNERSANKFSVTRGHDDSNGPSVRIDSQNQSASNIAPNGNLSNSKSADANIVVNAKEDNDQFTLSDNLGML